MLKLGIEHAPPLVTSALLLDARAHMGGGEPLQPGQVITAADIEAMLAAQGLAGRGILAGDVVYIYTGWSDNWNEPPYYAMGPGLGYDAAQLLGEKGVVLVALDNPFTDPANDGQLVGQAGPPEGTPEGLPFVIHHHNLTQSGVHNIQNANLAGTRRGPGVGVLHHHPAAALRGRFRVARAAHSHRLTARPVPWRIHWTRHWIQPAGFSARYSGSRPFGRTRRRSSARCCAGAMRSC